jgi:hypothetical protein
LLPRTQARSTDKNTHKNTTKQKCAQKHEEKRQVYNTISPKRRGISQICDVATVVQEELPKFGYRFEMKVEIFKNATFFWRPTAETYCLNMAISEFVSTKSGDFGAYFSQKSFACVQQ